MASAVYSDMIFDNCVPALGVPKPKIRGYILAVEGMPKSASLTHELHSNGDGLR